jgi:hypothetical protein
MFAVRVLHLVQSLGSRLLLLLLLLSFGALQVCCSLSGLLPVSACSSHPNMPRLPVV